MLVERPDATLVLLGARNADPPEPVRRSMISLQAPRGAMGPVAAQKGLSRCGGGSP